jgi:hypothetical protein
MTKTDYLLQFAELCEKAQIEIGFDEFDALLGGMTLMLEDASEANNEGDYLVDLAKKNGQIQLINSK